MSPAIVSGIVTGDVPVSYWPIFFLSLVTVPEVFAWVNSAQFLLVSKVANVSLFLPVCCFHKWRSRGHWDRVCPWVPSCDRCGRTPITHLKLISKETEVLIIYEINCVHCGRSFLHFHFISAVHIWLISYIINTHFFHGNIWTHNWPAPNVSGFIAQLVEHRTGNREVTSSNPVEVLNFFSGFFTQFMKIAFTATIISSLSEIEVKQLPYSNGSFLRDVFYKSILFCRVSVRLYGKVAVKVWYL